MGTKILVDSSELCRWKMGRQKVIFHQTSSPALYSQHKQQEKGFLDRVCACVCACVYLCMSVCLCVYRLEYQSAWLIQIPEIWNLPLQLSTSLFETGSLSKSRRFWFGQCSFPASPQDISISKQSSEVTHACCYAHFLSDAGIQTPVLYPLSISLA